MKNITPNYGDEPTHSAKVPLVALAKAPIGIRERKNNKIIAYVYDGITKNYIVENYPEKVANFIKMLDDISDEDSCRGITKKDILEIIPKFLEKHEKIMELRRRMSNERRQGSSQIMDKKISEFRTNLKKYAFAKLLEIESILDSDMEISENSLCAYHTEINDIIRDLDHFYAMGLKFSDGERKWSLQKVKEFAEDLLIIIKERLESIKSVS